LNYASMLGSGRRNRSRFYVRAMLPVVRSRISASTKPSGQFLQAYSLQVAHFTKPGLHFHSTVHRAFCRTCLFRFFCSASHWLKSLWQSEHQMTTLSSSSAPPCRFGMMWCMVRRVERPQIVPSSLIL